MKTNFKFDLRNPRPELPRAFTLIELLLVIATIAIIAALLLPALTHAKAQAQSASCIGNLRQLQRAWQTYVHDHNDALPPNNSEKRGFVQMGVSNAWGNSWVWGNAKVDTDSANIEHGVLFREAGSAAVFRCPADNSTVIGNPGVRRLRSYSANTWLNAHIQSGTIEQGINNSRINLRTAQQLVSQPPSRIFVFIDEHPQSIGDGIFGLPVPWFDSSGTSPGSQNLWWGASMPGDRHSQGCNLSFADGHAAHYRWLSPKKGMSEGDVQRISNPQDLKDLLRLQECAPKP